MLIAVLLGTLARGSKLERRAPAAVIVGAVLVGLSAVPLPYWFYAMWGVTVGIWQIAERTRIRSSRFGMAIILVALTLETLAGLAMEIPYQLPPAVTAKGRPVLWIIGDSVTAGGGNPKIETWPRIMARKHGIVVHHHSQNGETVGSALRMLDHQPVGDGIVLLEIGGNDLLGDTTAADFEQKLDSLLSVVCRPGRTVVMFELPLPPLRNSYGEIQRRLGGQYGVVLIPKRYFVSVLTGAGQTTDGIHLTQEGQDRMAEMVWRSLAPAYDE